MVGTAMPKAKSFNISNALTSNRLRNCKRSWPHPRQLQRRGGMSFRTKLVGKQRPHYSIESPNWNRRWPQRRSHGDEGEGRCFARCQRQAGRHVCCLYRNVDSSERGESKVPRRFRLEGTLRGSKGVPTRVVASLCGSRDTGKVRP